MVTSGDDKGRTGKVLRVLPKDNRVVVEGINIVRKHTRPSQRHPQGGVHEKELAIHLSKVSPVVDGKPTRVRFQTKPDGSKVRVAARGGAQIGTELRSSRSK
jgi:large subunit ribosomal protein L24